MAGVCCPLDYRYLSIFVFEIACRWLETMAALVSGGQPESILEGHGSVFARTVVCPFLIKNGFRIESLQLAPYQEDGAARWPPISSLFGDWPSYAPGMHPVRSIRERRVLPD